MKDYITGDTFSGGGQYTDSERFIETFEWLKSSLEHFASIREDLLSNFFQQKNRELQEESGDVSN